jgi:putative transposase
VIARANGGGAVFRSRRDYVEFLELIEGAWERFGAPALAYCLMPNHVHLVLRPDEGDSISRWMQWLLTRHAMRLNKRRAAMGAVWQPRFRGFPIEEDAHLLTVLRYVERNALRARLVERAEDWPWGSLAQRGGRTSPPWLAAVDLSPGWRDWVNEPQTAAELEAIRTSVNRGAPFGAEAWRAETAMALGLQSTLRPRGRRAIGVRHQ